MARDGTNTQKPKPTNSSVRTTHTCMHIIADNCGTQYNMEKFRQSSNPTDNHLVRECL